MSDLARWAIFAASAVVIIGVILAFPVIKYIDLDVFKDALDIFVEYVGDALIFGRGLLNNFLSPWARVAVTGLLEWFLCKFFLTYTIKIGVWVKNFIMR